MSERPKSPFFLTRPEPGTPVNWRVDSVLRELDIRRIEYYSTIAQDLRRGDGRIQIDDIEQVLAVIRSGTPGIVINKSERAISVVYPEGQFTWKGYSGTLLSARFKSKYVGHSSVDIQRNLPGHFGPNLPSSEILISTTNPKGSTTTVWRDSYHQADYEGTNLTSLAFVHNNDSTSKFRLETTLNPATGQWTSMWEPAYGPYYNMGPYPLVPGGEAVPYRFNSKMTIQLGQAPISDGHLALNIIITEEDGRANRTLFSAPLTLPEYLAPATDFKTHLVWLKNYGLKTYLEQLSQQTPVISETAPVQV